MRALLVLLTLALALVACGGGDDDDRVVEGTGFSVEVPDGWRDASERSEALEFAGFQPDVVLVGRLREGFAPSINVVLESSVSPEVKLDEYVEAGRRVLREGRLGGERIPGEVVELSEVRAGGLDGQRAAIFDHVRSVEGRRLRARQVVAIRGSSAYTLTYTALADRFDAGAGALDGVLASWRWR